MKKTYNIEVDCANCAAKMESAINRMDGVTKATVNFLTQKLTLETTGESQEELLPKVIKTCKRVEPDFSIQFPG